MATGRFQFKFMTNNPKAKQQFQDALPVRSFCSGQRTSFTPSSQPLLSLPAGPQHQRREERRPEMRDWPLLMHLSSLPLGFQGSLQRTAPQCVSELPSPWVLLLSRAPRPTPSQQRCCICLILSV